MKGIKISCVELEPATSGQAKEMGILYFDLGNVPGYIATDSLGRKSWMDENCVKSNYFLIDKNNFITKEDVEKFIWKFDAGTIGKKTTVATATTLTGYEITKTSACVDPKKYNIIIGKDIAYNDIINDLWDKLGFVLQWAINGINPNKEKE